MAVLIRPLDEHERDMWLATFELAALVHGIRWTLIGGQMTLLHAFERGARPPWTSRDSDILVDARQIAVVAAPSRVATLLLQAGYALGPASPDGVAHRFVRDPDLVIDVLAPEGTGPRTDLTTVPPSRTIGVPGGTQALERTETVEVVLGDASALLPRPSLLAAILLKARAIGVADNPDKHRRDLTFLCGLVPDVGPLRAEISRSERDWLASRAELSDPAHPSWGAASDPRRAWLVFRSLTTPNEEPPGRVSGNLAV